MTHDVLQAHYEKAYDYYREQEIVTRIIKGRTHWPTWLTEWLASLAPVRRAKSMRAKMFEAILASSEVEVTPFIEKLIRENGDKAGRHLDHPCKALAKAIAGQVGNLELMRTRITSCEDKKELIKLLRAVYNAHKGPPEKPFGKGTLSQEVEQVLCEPTWFGRLYDEDIGQLLVKEFGITGNVGIARNPATDFGLLMELDITIPAVAEAIAERASGERGYTLGRKDCMKGEWSTGVVTVLMRPFSKSGDYSSDSAATMVGALAAAAKREGKRLNITVGAVEKSTGVSDGPKKDSTELGSSGPAKVLARLGIEV